EAGSREVRQVGFTGSGSFWSRLRLGLSLSAIVAGSMLVGAGAQAKQASTTSAATSASTISSGITIQNLSSTTSTNTVVTYYNAEPSVRAPRPLASLRASGSVCLYPSQAPSGFAVSGVVSWDVSVGAISNMLQSSPPAGEAYDGFPASGTGAATTTAYAA